MGTKVDQLSVIASGRDLRSDRLKVVPALAVTPTAAASRPRARRRRAGVRLVTSCKGARHVQHSVAQCYGRCEDGELEHDDENRKECRARAVPFRNFRLSRMVGRIST